MNDSRAPVVLGFDPRARAIDTLAAALALARARGVGVHLVHAIDYPESMWTGLSTEWAGAARTDLTRQAEHAVEAELQRAFGTLGAERPRDFTREIVLGHPARAIAAACERTAASLVVVGPHHKDHALDLGSVPRALLAQGPAGVWVQRGPWRDPTRVLVPVDLSPLSLTALATARDLVRPYDGELSVLHCFVRPDFFPDPAPSETTTYPTYVVEDVQRRDEAEFRELENTFDWRGVRRRLEFVEGVPAQETLARETEVDAIAVGTHGRTGLARFILGNVAAAILARATGSVLGVRPD